MTNLEFWEGVRAVNAFLAFSCVVLLVTGLTAKWHCLRPSLRQVLVSFAALLTVNAYGSGEALSQGAPVGVRVVLLLTALIGLVPSLLVWVVDEEPKE